MIIGISGKIGSGKDTVGKIIQYATSNIRAVDNIKFYLDDPNRDQTGVYRMSGWEIKKYAAKLKQIVCLLTGCTMEQLEDIEFKNSYLPEEWDRSVKSWIQEKSFELAEQYGYTFDENIPAEERAENKKHALYKAVVDGWKKAETMDDLWVKQINRETQKTTYREMLQILGTDAMRNVIHENVWVNALFADYKASVGNRWDNEKMERVDHHILPKWIITDMRFPNELNAIKDRGGITIRVNRKGFYRRCLDCEKEFNLRDPKKEPVPTRRFFECPNCHSFKTESISEIHSDHPSETSLDNARFDYVIENDGTLEDLIVKVKDVLNKSRITS